MSETWEVHALRYADRNARTRGDSFLLADDHAAPHPMDYFVWVLTSGSRTIVVDTGYDEAEGRRRGRPILQDPAAQLAGFGMDPETVETVIVTHLHYDHAGSLGRFPKARFHLQAAEMAYATGPCMCHEALRSPFTYVHVAEMLRHVYSGRVVFHDGDAEIAPGVTVHRIGGHSRGLQAVRVLTREGWICLASDAAHFYENFLREKPFPIVVDVENMLEGFRRIRSLSGRVEHVVPGHDPLLRRLFPEVAPDIFRLDVKPLALLDAAGRLL